MECVCGKAVKRSEVVVKNLVRVEAFNTRIVKGVYCYLFVCKSCGKTYDVLSSTFQIIELKDQ